MFQRVQAHRASANEGQKALMGRGGIYVFRCTEPCSRTQRQIFRNERLSLSASAVHPKNKDAEVNSAWKGKGKRKKCSPESSYPRCSPPSLSLYSTYLILDHPLI